MEDAIVIKNEMSEQLRRWFFSPLAGTTFNEWKKILKRYGSTISARYLMRAIFTTSMSLINSAIARWEKIIYKDELEKLEIQSPVFIIGHYRSGTTHLWKLLAVDDCFVYPTITEALFPSTMLTFGRIANKLAEWFSPGKRPQDNVKTTAKSPLEEEWALCAETFLSIQLGRYFPQFREHFKYMLSLEEATKQERNQWKGAMQIFARKLQLQKGKNATLLFKAPASTAKIRLLLEIFPDARFIHIYRNPYRVFQSTLKMEKKSLPYCTYQSINMEGLEDYVIWRYNKMFESFFSDKKLIPAGNFTQVAFEDLIQDRLGTIKKIYRDLSLGSFKKNMPSLERYINSIDDYRKNNYPDLPADKKAKIASAWRRNFNAFGYATNLPANLQTVV